MKALDGKKTGLLSLSKRGVIVFSGFMLSARLKIFLHAFRYVSAAYSWEYRRLSSITLQAYTSPL